MDDMLMVGGTQNEIDNVKHALTRELKISELGPVSLYLGIKIIHDISSGKMFSSHAPYVKKIQERFEMQQAEGVDTPIVKQNALVYADKRYQADNSTIIWYQEFIGSLM